MTRKRSSKLSRFSFFFLFKSCRKDKKNRQTLVNTSDDESCKDADFYNSNIVKESNPNSSNSTKKSSIIGYDEGNCCRESGKGAVPLSSPNVLSPNDTGESFTYEKRSYNKIANNKVVKNLNFKLSPLKKRHNNFSPSKESPLNCHVTVELAQPFQNSNLQVEANLDNLEDKEPLLQKSESLSPKRDSNISLKEEKKPSSTAKIGRSKSFSDKETFFQRKQQLTRKLHPLLNAKAAKNNNQCFTKSASNLNQKEKFRSKETDKLPFETKRMVRQKVPKFRSEKSKSLLDIASGHTETIKTSDAVSHNTGKTSDKSRNKEHCGGSSVANHQTPEKIYSNKFEESTSTTKTTEWKKRSPRKQTQQRPCSMYESPDESNYVMLRSIPPVFKSSVKRQIQFEEGFTTPSRNYYQHQTKATPVTSAKSHENLRYGVPQNYDYSNCTAGYQENFNDSQLYSSPAVDYAAKVEDLLAKLRRSLKSEPVRSSYATWNPANFDLSNQGFPIKKSKSLEPLTACSQFLQHDENLYTANRYSQSNRSRTRARHIAKKYNMYTSNENITTLPRNSTWDQKVNNTSSGFGNDDYVYLSQIPYYSKEPTYSANSYSPSKEPYIMSTRSGDYYHLNLYVHNSRPTPDGAESMPHLDRPSGSKELPSGYSTQETLCKPQVYYSLDV